MSAGEDKLDRERAVIALTEMAPHAALGLVAEGLVHNLSGIAQAMSMQADLLAMAFAGLAEAVDGGDAAGMAELIGQRARTVERLVRKSGEMQELLHAAAALVSSGGRTAPVEIPSLVDEAMGLAACDMFFKHRVEKEVEVADGLPPLAGVRSSLLMVLLQLLKNSAESLAASPPEPPRIRLRAVACGPGVRIEVEDNGHAAPLDREEIFAPFFTTREGHAGIGLWLARRLAAEAGGALFCERLGEDGALFVLELACGGDS